MQRLVSEAGAALTVPGGGSGAPSPRRWSGCATTAPLALASRVGAATSRLRTHAVRLAHLLESAAGS
jgi:hypothetical protein